MSCNKKIKLETLSTSQALVSTEGSVESGSASHQLEIVSTGQPLVSTGRSVESGSTSHQLESLSDEILLKIFSFVGQQDRGRLASVCSRFKRLAMDYTLWKKVREGHKFFLINLVFIIPVS